MRLILKITLSLFLLILFLNYPTDIYAQTTPTSVPVRSSFYTIEKDSSGKTYCQQRFGAINGYPSQSECEKALTQGSLYLGQYDCPQYVGYNVSPCYVDDNTTTVTIQFTNLKNLTNGDQYIYCFKTKLSECDDEWRGWAPILGKALSPQSPSIEVCGSGQGALKDDCKHDGHDYFYPERAYVIHLAQADDDDCDGGCTKIKDSSVILNASFYIHRYYPTIVEPKKGPRPDLTFSDTDNKDGPDSITVTLEGRNNRGGKGDEDSDIYNDYYIVISNYENSYEAYGCVYIPPGGTGTANIKLPHSIEVDGSENSIIPGAYRLRIKDGVGGNEEEGDQAVCHEGKFTFYDIPFTIGEYGTAGAVEESIRDPFGRDVRRDPPPAGYVPVCPTGFKDPKTGYCTGIDTAIGLIHTKPEIFLRDAFTVVLSIGGIAAIVFLIQAGYTLMTSAGNKERVGAAREQITSAIMGLIFIILSTAILEFIGIDILHIPGFGR